MIDDLVTRGVSEPYRMFTSRAEYRLKLRADNADQRLTSLGLEIGCVGKERGAAFSAKSHTLSEARNMLDTLSLTPSEAQRAGLNVNQDGRRRSAFELLSYPAINLKTLGPLWPQVMKIPAIIGAQLETDARYAVYLKRQEADIAALRKDEAIELPANLDYGSIAGFSNEVRQKLQQHRPVSLAQASRIDGITPAALMLLAVHVKKSLGRKSA
jgi:tRNA uridine 5-carboxymethylaminomethyl modification enzyme